MHSEGNGKESGLLPQPQNSSIGFQLLTDRKLTSENKLLKVAPSAESDDEMLVVDETPTRSKAPTVDTSSATIKPASLKLKLSGIGLNLLQRIFAGKSIAKQRIVNHH